MADHTTELSTGGWFTSSYSANNAQCVEVRFAVGGASVRDSKHRSGPLLHFENADWAPFVASLKSGRHLFR